MMSAHKLLNQCKVSKRLQSNFSANILLQDANRKRCIRKFQAMSIKQGTKLTKRKAAVLIPIYTQGDQVSLVYTLRAAHLKTQGGQVSFPGGMQDKSDKTANDIALRETNEELGIRKEDIDIWGAGNPIIRQDMKIIPIIGSIKHNLPLNALQLNKQEVEEIFTVPIERLCDPNLIRHTQFRATYSTPTYLGGPYRIWGLTAVMTFMFLKAFIPPGLYKHQVKYVPDVARALENS